MNNRETPAGRSLVGRSLERREDARFLSGHGCFVDDIQRPGMLHAAVVRSPLASARIKSINVSAALALPGVVAVYCHRDIDTGVKPIPLGAFTPLPGFARFLQTPIAHDRVVFVGEPVALVVAEDRYIAEDALELVEVDYEPLEVVVDVHASREGKVLVHPAQGTNVATNYSVSRGKADEVFAQAAYTRKETLKVHRHSAVPLETRGLVAEWDAAASMLRVWGATKLLFRNREILSGMLGLPEAQVELIEVDVGGSFGVRGEFYPEDFLVPYAARRLGRPVKWVEDRREHFMASNHSREMECTLEIAVDADGIILALRGALMIDMGAYVRPNGGVGPGKVSQFMCGPYRIEHAAFDVTALITNKTPVGSYRGPGRYESSFFRERMVDLAAADLGIDPAEFRMRNLIRPEQMPWHAGSLVPGAPATVYDTGDYPAVLAEALQAFDYGGLAPLRGKDKDGRLHGVGIGCFVESTGGGPGETARIRVSDSGQVHLYIGSSSAGQGHETVLAQILADELDTTADAITVFHGTTSYVTKGWGTYHSRSVVMGGSAILLAAKKLRDQILAVQAHKRRCAVDDLAWGQDGTVRSRDGTFAVTLADLAKDAAADPALQEALEASATYTSSELTYTFGTQIAHVAVDPATAVVEVVRFLTVEDVGRMINPAVVHGQTIGASVQGLGSTFLDHFVYDESGQLLTGSFADYLLATSTDFPRVEALSLERSKALSNPLGAKGAGEGGIAATGAALANAVEDALRSIGVRVLALPLSPDNIAALLRAARACKPPAPAVADD